MSPPKVSEVEVSLTSTKAKDSSERLKALLKTQFQLDVPELDFGIYRIMNYRRREIEEFIERHLLQTVEKEFERYRTLSSKELLEKIEEKQKEIERLEKQLGQKILRNGDIEKFRDSPLVKEYLDLKNRLDKAEITENVKNQVFNDLYNFFSRYYEDGDFVSKRRYSSKQHRYAVPYNGEEVKFHWTNFDQHYVKTSEVFKDYEFRLNGWRIMFRTIIVNVPARNVKEERRYFVVHSEKPISVDKENKTCIIQFEYRPLNDGDLKRCGIRAKPGEEEKISVKQEKFNEILQEEILKRVSDTQLKTALSARENEKTALEKHLYRFTRRVTNDFFIHKNLKAFLERELDYFIKTEIVDLDNLEPIHVTRAKVVEGIGKKIIEFLAQIEEFQNKLWEKKKFVIKTAYVITTDLIPLEFHKEILDNKEQLEEWKDLGFGDVKKDDLIQKRLPIDTKHFSENFEERLLEKLGDKGSLDDLVDGILIKSDNFHALRLLQEKYKEEVKCIYIDPPYNTGSDEFIYKDNYQHSSWLSMMAERLALAKELMRKDGAIFVSIDNHELANLQEVMEEEYGRQNLVGIFAVQSNPRGRYLEKHIATSHEYLLLYSKSSSDLQLKGEALSEKHLDEYKFQDKYGKYRLLGLRKRGAYSRREDRPNLHFPIFFDPKTSRISLEKEKESMVRILPKLEDGSDGVWRWSKEKIKKDIHLLVTRKVKHRYDVFQKDYLTEEKTLKPRTVWFDKSLNYERGKEALKDLFGYSPYDYPKPVALVEKVVSISAEKDSLILDFLAGSGTTAHAIMNLNKKDYGKRKFVLVEMADYLDTIILPRLKKLFYSLNWKEGKPQGADGISQIIKYQHLEQYEDALHNIEFLNEVKGQRVLQLLRDNEQVSEYFMKYFLQYETEGSPSLLNIKQFENPFEYKLKIISSGKGEEVVNVDLAETFNYLIGLKINKYKFLKENGRKYIFVFGERGNRRIAVVWRATKDIDLKNDENVIDEAINDYSPDEIFVNGDAHVKNYKVTEIEFKALMGA